ncbi:MAG TPA: hypothetical protein PK360_13055 [bacterium]|nr:hypothetical protein [bacterium]
MKTILGCIAGLALIGLLNGCSSMEKRPAPSDHSWTNDLNPSYQKLTPDWDIFDLTPSSLAGDRRLVGEEQMGWDALETLR